MTRQKVGLSDHVGATRLALARDGSFVAFGLCYACLTHQKVRNVDQVPVLAVVARMKCGDAR
jgi:hypothetical protein